jgi:hypothetical protein
MFISCVCCVLCRYWPLCERLIARSEESYVVCVCVCLIVCDIETSTLTRPRPDLGCCATEINRNVYGSVYAK